MARAASFYPFIYQRRFRDFKDQGYAFLEAIMDQAEPSYGYSVLAQIMAGSEHKVAITTNFDNLVADALSIYTDALPLVCGHESLTGYIRAKLRRPLIAKIHRDLLLHPFSSPEEIGVISKEWETALRTILGNYTPVVIGYGGNDGSLMGFLEKLDPIKGGIFWCYRSGDIPSESVIRIIDRHQGRLVPILGFDELMLQLGEKLKIPDPRPNLQKTHDSRVSAWQRQFEELNRKVSAPAATAAAEKELKPVREAAAATVDRLTKETDWWAWELKANAETDPDKKEAIYRQGLEDFPKSPELACNYGVFLCEVRKDFHESAKYYRQAFALDPNDVVYLGNLAYVLGFIPEKYDEAETAYQKTLKLSPKDANATGNFGMFLWHVRKNYDEAERLLRKALQLNPKAEDHVANLAQFLFEVRQKQVEAERYFRQAMDLDPKRLKTLTTYARFLEFKGKVRPALSLYRQAMEIGPRDRALAKRVAALERFAKRVKK